MVIFELITLLVLITIILIHIDHLQNYYVQFYQGSLLGYVSIVKHTKLTACLRLERIQPRHNAETKHIVSKY